jgi:hypothetical protein
MLGRAPPGFDVVLTDGRENRVVLVAVVSVEDMEFAERTEKRECVDIALRYVWRPEI